MPIGTQEDPLDSYRGRFGVRFDVQGKHNSAHLTRVKLRVNPALIVFVCAALAMGVDRAQMLNWGASMEFRFSRNWKFSASRDPVRDCSDPGSQSSTLGYQLGVDLVSEKSY